MKEELMVVKSNMLVNAKYDCSIIEQKIIVIGASFLTEDNQKTVEISKQTYQDLLGIETFNYVHFNTTLKKLKQNTIIMTSINKKTGELEEGIITGWIDRVVYKDATIYLTFNDDVLPHLRNLKEKYTSYGLKNILKLQSKYSIRLYEILKSFEYIGFYTIKIDEFREVLFIGNKYSRFNDFTDKILNPIIDEINALNDIIISYTPIKRGVKYESLRFSITSNSKQIESELDIPPEVMMVKSMNNNELYTSIKTAIMMKYKCIFTPIDIEWIDVNQYTSYALQQTYLGLITGEWDNHEIKFPKSFFAENLRRESQRGA